MKLKKTVIISIIITIILWGLALGLSRKFYSLPSKSNINELKIEESDTLDDISYVDTIIYMPVPGKEMLSKKIVKGNETESKSEEISEIIRLQMNEFLLNKIVKSDRIELINIFVDKQLIYLNFSSAMSELDRNDMSSLLAIYSIVNSLTEVKDIKSVQFLINGKVGTKNLKSIYSRKDNLIM